MEGGKLGKYASGGRRGLSELLPGGVPVDVTQELGTTARHT